MTDKPIIYGRGSPIHDTSDIRLFQWASVGVRTVIGQRENGWAALRVQSDRSIGGVERLRLRLPLMSLPPLIGK